MTNWNDLSMKERAAYIKAGVKNGLRSIDDIQKSYNDFANGGPKKDKSLFDKEKVLNRVYGDNMGTSGGPGTSFPVINAITQYFTNDNNSVSNRIEYLEKIRKSLPEKTPDSKANLMKRRLAGEISDKELWEGSAAYGLEMIKQHEDAKRIYLGYEPKYGTMEPSQYQPTIGKANNPYQVNALLSDESFEDLILPLYQQWKSGNITDFKRTKWSSKIKDFKKEPRIEDHGKTALIKDIPYLSNATLSEGFDNKGQYISLFDTWDYNTGYMGKPGDNIGKWIGGKPFDIYQRYYLDEWLDIQEEAKGNPYIVPAVITESKKANGGSLNNTLAKPFSYQQIPEVRFANGGQTEPPKLKRVDLQEWYDKEGLEIAGQKRKVSISALEQLQDSLIARGQKDPKRYGLPQRLAILATSANEIDERGAATVGVGGNGYLGLSKSRMPLSYLDDTPKGRGAQIHHILEDLNNVYTGNHPMAGNWNDGGSGGLTVMSGQDGFNKFWSSPSVWDAAQYLNKSYIRPAGRIDAWNNRSKTAKNMQKHLK